MARHGDHHRHGAGRNDDVLALIVLAAAADDAVRLERGLAGDDVRARLLQQVLHAADELGRDLALALLDLLEAEGARVAEDILLHERAHLLHGVGLVDEVLRGDAADVQARAAEMLLFKQGHLQPLLRGRDPEGITAGAAADD